MYGIEVRFHSGGGFLFVSMFLAYALAHTSLPPPSLSLSRSRPPPAPRSPPLFICQVLLHIRTEKGMGYPPAMAASDKYHGVAKFNVATGKQHKGVSLES